MKDLNKSYSLMMDVGTGFYNSNLTISFGGALLLDDI
jgi:hypothetical protein